MCKLLQQTKEEHKVLLKIRPIKQFPQQLLILDFEGL